MMKLLHICGSHLAAVTRDLIVAGYHLKDIPSKLSWVEFHAMVTTAPPGTAVFEEQNDGWDRTNTMVATLIEAMTGNAKITGRFERPGLSPEELKRQEMMRKQQEQSKREPGAAKAGGGMQYGHRGDVMTIDEFKKRYEARQEEWAAADRKRFPEPAPAKTLTLVGGDGAGVNDG